MNIIKEGQFGRFWDSGYSRNGYSYGYLKYITNPKVGFIDDKDYIWQHFEPSDPQPEWTTRRRIIADRAKLCQILLDKGYKPDHNMNFLPPKSDGSEKRYIFYTNMWNYCGEDVKWDDNCQKYICNSGYSYHPELTEEY
jgi:hypothetical protein